MQSVVAVVAADAFFETCALVYHNYIIYHVVSFINTSLLNFSTKQKYL